MASYTRRTHVVRVKDKDDEDRYVDVEVLDAISFRIKRGEEVIFNCDAQKSTPFIVDDTGNDLAKSPAKPTRRSHVEDIKSDDGESELLVEVIDAVSFRDKRGEEWILDMPSKKASPYNKTTGKGAGDATRQTHNEKLSPDPEEKDPKENYLTVERSDILAFRSARGKEMIVKMPSFDNGKGDRASTFISSPENYDPTNEDIKVPDNKDPNFYVKFVKDKDIFFDDAKTVSQGPLWWIRKVSGPAMLFAEIGINRSGFDPADDFRLKAISNFNWGIGVADDPKQQHIEVDLTAKAEAAKDFKPTLSPVDSKGKYTEVNAVTMPVNADAKPKISLKDDLYWCGLTKTGTQAQWTVLLWFNLAKIRKGLPKDSDVEVTFVVPPLFKQTKPKAQTGYYLWVTSANLPVTVTTYTRDHQAGGTSSTTNTFWPGPWLTLAPPTVDTAFTPGNDLYGSDTMQNEVVPYSLGNSNIFMDYGSYLLWGQGPAALLFTPNIADPSGYDTPDPWSLIGFVPTEFPGNNPAGVGYGFQTHAGAQAWADALNALQAARAASAADNLYWYGPTTEEAARQYGDIAPKGVGGYPPWRFETWGVYSPSYPTWNYVVIEIDFPVAGKPPPSLSATINVTGAYFAGPTTFDYDNMDNPKFKLPTAEGKIATTNLTQVGNETSHSAQMLIHVKIDKSNKVTVTKEEDPNGDDPGQS